jgi:hypothetical protein
MSIVIAAVICATLGASGALDIRLSMKGDTFLPLEPIYARLDVSNEGSTVFELPSINNFTAGRVFDFSVVSPTGEALRPKPRWRLADVGLSHGSLLPGATAHAAVDFSGYVSDQNPELRSSVEAPPGTYSASCRRGDAVSNSVTFVVREPTADERRALVMYGDLVYYRDVIYWNRPAGPRLNTPLERAKDRLRRTEELARKIVKQHPRTIYALLAERELAWNYHSRVTGTDAHLLRSSPQSLREAWRDSTRAIYTRALSTHPDAPIAEHMLSYDRLPEVFDDSVYTRALLQRLSAAHPGTLVGIEAAKQLRLLAKSTAEQR